MGLIQSILSVTKYIERSHHFAIVPSNCIQNEGLQIQISVIQSKLSVNICYIVVITLSVCYSQNHVSIYLINE